MTSSVWLIWSMLRTMNVPFSRLYVQRYGGTEMASSMAERAHPRDRFRTRVKNGCRISWQRGSASLLLYLNSLGMRVKAECGCVYSGWGHRYWLGRHFPEKQWRDVIGAFSERVPNVYEPTVAECVDVFKSHNSGIIHIRIKFIV